MIGSKEGIILDMNDSIQEISGYQKTDLIGKHIMVLFTESYVRENPLRFDLVEKGEKVVRQREIVRKDGSSIRIEMHSKTLSKDKIVTYIRNIEPRLIAEELKAKTDNIIENINKGVSSHLGEQFFETIIYSIRNATEADIVIICELFPNEENLCNILFYLDKEKLKKNIKFYNIESPSNIVIEKGVYFCEWGIQQKFPNDNTLKSSQVEGYIGISTKDSNRNTNGLVILLYKKELKQLEQKLNVLNIFSERIGAELERLDNYKKLKSSQLLFEKVFNHNSSLILLTEFETGEIIEANESFKEASGFSNQNIRGKSTLELNLISEEDRLKFKEKIATLKRIENFEGIYKNQFTNERIHTIGSVELIEVNEKKLILQVVTNITDLKLKEKELINSREKFEKIFNSSIDPILIIDREQNLLAFNESFIKKTGYTKHELMGLKVYDLIQSKDFINLQKRQEKIINNEFIPPFELQFTDKNGNNIPIEINSQLIDYEGKAAIMSVIRDISERKNMERKILDTIIQTEEKERKKFAESLHDELGPFLSGIKLYINELTEDSNSIEKQELNKYLKEMVDEAVQKTRNISNLLMPNLLSDYGLVKAISSFCHKINQLQKVSISFDTNILEERFPETYEIIYYRIITELINNSIKHANAKHIYIHIVYENDFLKLTFKDDGIGFNIEKSMAKNNGFGLITIINRLKSINGQYKFESKKNKGIQFNIKAEIK